MAGLDIRLTIQTPTPHLIRFQIRFPVQPWISKRSKDWKFLLGFEAVVDVADITNFYFYPHASLDIIIIEKVLVPFIGLSGEFQKNTYMDLLMKIIYYSRLAPERHQQQSDRIRRFERKYQFSGTVQGRCYLHGCSKTCTFL